jgi:DNA polymerase-3 subunit epsilon
VLIAPRIPSRFDDLATPLCDVTFVVLDLETTGMSPAHDAITEIGAVKYRAGECLGRFDTLVNPGVPIPPMITVLTGITEAMVLPAPRIDEVLPALLEFIGSAVLVGHNFRFDTSFLDAALLRRGAAPIENPRVDTLGLSRRLLHDEVTDLKLGTLAQRLRVATEPCHRALADADATAEVLHALLERAGTLGVLGLDDLLALPTLRVHASSNKHRLTERTPRAPGIYRFRDRAGDVIYVGRATNLRRRVRAHFHGARGRRVPQLVLETAAIDWIECADELEASVREARLIQTLDPRFNRRGKGWRAYVYLKLTAGDRFPRLVVTRHASDDARSLGPLTSSAAATALRSAIEAAAPQLLCLRDISDVERERTVDRVVRGFDGDPDALLEPLAQRLSELVAAEHYEAAVKVRDQLGTLAEALRRHHLLTWLCRSSRVRLLTPSGVVELEHGFLRLADDESLDASGDELTRVPERHRLDELLVVAHWLERETEAGRARLVEPGNAAPPWLVAAPA